MFSRKGLRLIVTVICLLSFALMISLIYRHVDYTTEIYASKQAELKQLTHEAARHIESILRAAMASAEHLAQQLTNSRVNKNNMEEELKRMLVTNDNYYGATITFAPFRYDPKKRLYSIYYSRSGAAGKLEFNMSMTFTTIQRPPMTGMSSPWQKAISGPNHTGVRQAKPL